MRGHHSRMHRLLTYSDHSARSDVLVVPCLIAGIAGNMPACEALVTVALLELTETLFTPRIEIPHVYLISRTKQLENSS
ncbi:uncharacterized protein BJX67DRAFT_355888 [Aspergillus lucknowensis]|uniref:Uncharacterized protein n=1 Tax=Aspergillus lucknowensis TaxID=176173 RepID=A0ABR4LPJ9_9EURO